MKKEVDDGFADTRAEFRAVRAEIGGLRSEVVAMRGEINALSRLMIQLFASLFVTMIFGFAGLFVSHP